MILTGWHDLLHEYESVQVVDNMVRWIEERIRVSELRETLD
jgi:hypothetical protein